MNIVVDTNIVFSAILNSNGIISDLLFNLPENYSFFSPEFMISEINKHHKKLLSISKLSENQLYESQYRVLSQIRLLSELIISKSSWDIAYKLTKNIDEDDTPFIALTLEIKGILWTGDKKLIKGLKLLGWERAISTEDFKNLINY